VVNGGLELGTELKPFSVDAESDTNDVKGPGEPTKVFSLGSLLEEQDSISTWDPWLDFFLKSLKADIGVGRSLNTVLFLLNQSQS
jgi:hypothetical protein